VEPRWLSRAVVLAIHDEQLAEHGGASGLRDEGLLDAALARPLNVLHYEPNATISRLAAAYALGLARNHPFMDGNKRLSFTVTETFLLLNGHQLVAGDADCLHVWLAMASGTLGDEAFIAWLQAHVEPVAS
jgi:death on curing protein